MGSILVVVAAPILQLFPGVGKAHEPVGVQTLCSQLAIERFNEGIIGRLSRPAEVQSDAVGVCPEVQIARDKLRSLIDADRAGRANVGTDSVQGRHTSSPR